FALKPHFERLERSLAALSLALDIRTYGLEALLREGLERAGFDETLVYIQVTRGVAPRHHEFPAAPVAPTVVMTFKQLYRIPQAHYERGVAVISAPDQRWRRCDIKTIALLPNILAKQQARAAGAFETLLVDGEGRVTEGSSTSAFCVVVGAVHTAPEGPQILPSITRGQLLELAGELGLPVVEDFRTLDEFKAADEVFLAGTTTEAMPVVRIDDAVIGTGAPAPITLKLREAFLAKAAQA
ncbi:aminotransferase class IV, partial [bacterium]|nr:aminotransferase class IV [bacterium]